MKSYQKLLLVLLIFVSLPVLADLRDVPNGHWASSAVDEVVNEYNLMKGDPNGNFAGTRAVSRYEFATVMSRMIEHYNSEIEADRKDLDSVVNIMELFQKELKTVQNKLNSANQAIADQNATISELNELVVLVAQEIDGEAPVQVASNNSAPIIPAAPVGSSARIAALEAEVDKLQNRGFFLDTIIRGTLNDVKKISSSVAKAIPEGSESDANEPEEEDEVVNSSAFKASPESPAWVEENIEAEILEPVQELTEVEIEEDVEASISTDDWGEEELEELREIY